MELESIMLSEISQRKTNTVDLTHMWNLRNKTNEQRKKETSQKTLKNRLLTIENKLTRDEVGGMVEINERD